MRYKTTSSLPPREVYKGIDKCIHVSTVYCGPTPHLDYKKITTTHDTRVYQENKNVKYHAPVNKSLTTTLAIVMGGVRTRYAENTVQERRRLKGERGISVCECGCGGRFSVLGDLWRMASACEDGGKRKGKEKGNVPERASTQAASRIGTGLSSSTRKRTQQKRGHTLQRPPHPSQPGDDHHDRGSNEGDEQSRWDSSHASLARRGRGDGSGKCTSVCKVSP